MTRARDVANIDGILTTKGDIYAATAASTPARLGVGSNGDTIVADSSTSTGLRYTAGNPISNPVINSSFLVWQRATTSTAANVYGSADRWYQRYGAANGSFSQVTTGLPDGFRYGMKVQRVAGQTSGDGISVSQVFETSNSIPYAGKTVTLSFYAKAGANFSPTGSKMAIRLFTGTGTDQSVASSIGGWTGYAEPIEQDATLTTSWQRFTFTATIASTATQIGMIYYLFGTGTAGADDSYSITGIQLDIGSVALPFRTTGATIQGELAACQRYYWRTASSTAYVFVGNGQATSTTAGAFMINNPVPMRVAALTVDYSTLGVTDALSIQSAITSLIVQQASNLVNAISTGGSSGLTQYRPYFLSNQASTSGYIGFGAEL